MDQGVMGVTGKSVGGCNHGRLEEVRGTRLIVLQASLTSYNFSLCVS